MLHAEQSQVTYRDKQQLIQSALLQRFETETALRGCVTGQRSWVTNKGSYLRLKLATARAQLIGSVLNSWKRTTREGDATQRQRWRNADRCVLLSHIAATPLNYEWGPRAPLQCKRLLPFMLTIYCLFSLMPRTQTQPPIVIVGCGKNLK